MRTKRLLAVGSVALLLAAACWSGDAGTAPSSTASETREPSETDRPSPTPAETSEPTETPSSGGETELETEDSSLGTILTDSDGATLYVFLNDTAGESTCYDECADTWPPVRARGELSAGGGVNESLLGTTERRDGTSQVTYDGMPLYYFADDRRPGDVNGQGIGDVWFVVSPDGGPIQG